MTSYPIAVIGGSGFIGTRLVRRLLALGHEVRIFDLEESKAFPELYRHGDVRDHAAIVTPNRHEAAMILGQPKPIDDVGSAIEAARQIVKKFGVSACVIKGLRRTDDKEDESVDIYHDAERTDEVYSEWRPTENTFGAGTVFSAAITAGLAAGIPLFDAVCTAKTVALESIRQATDLGAGRGPVNHFAYSNVKKK